MSADDPRHGADFYTPEEKREMYKKFSPPKPPARNSVIQGVGALVLAVLYIGVWLLVIGIGLIVGIAIIKWAIEELAK